MTPHLFNKCFQRGTKINAPHRRFVAGLSVLYKVVGFFSLVICMQLFLCQNLEGEVIDRIVAVVNGEVITESELEEALIPFRAQYSQTIRSKRELKQKLKEARSLTLEQLIGDKLLLQKAKEEKIKVDEDEVEKMVAEMKKRLSSKDRFQEWLNAQRLTEPQLKERFREQIRIRKLINKKLRPSIRVSPEEVKIFYEKNKDKFLEGPQVSLSYILIKGPPERENNEAEILVRQVLEKLKEGVDFNLLAKEYSDDPSALDSGDLGFISINKLPPELREIVEKLEVGEISEIIRSPSGFNIIKLIGMKEAKEGELSEAEDLIEDEIFRNKLEEKYQVWLEELKEEAFIERK